MWRSYLFVPAGQHCDGRPLTGCLSEVWTDNLCSARMMGTAMLETRKSCQQDEDIAHASASTSVTLSPLSKLAHNAVSKFVRRQWALDTPLHWLAVRRRVTDSDTRARDASPAVALVLSCYAMPSVSDGRIVVGCSQRHAVARVSESLSASEQQVSRVAGYECTHPAPRTFVQTRSMIPQQHHHTSATCDPDSRLTIGLSWSTHLSMSVLQLPQHSMEDTADSTRSTLQVVHLTLSIP